MKSKLDDLVILRSSSLQDYRASVFSIMKKPLYIFETVKAETEQMLKLTLIN